MIVSGNFNDAWLYVAAPRRRHHCRHGSHRLLGICRTDAVLIGVEDAGTGIDPKIADRIFGSLFTTKPHGMGMGLSICQSIIEAHGGHIRASPRVPHGTAFRFTVPTAPRV